MVDVERAPRAASVALRPGDTGRPSAAGPLLAVRGLSKVYPGVKALDAISLDIRQGEIVGLVGPNGAGKTTLFECVQGLMRYEAGSIELLGRTVGEGLPNALTQRIGVTPQFFALPPSLKVIEIARMYDALYDRSIGAAAALEATDLGAQANVRFGRLSGGQKRRLALALALIGDPDFLFLDEPTGDLDPQSRRFIWDRVRESVARSRCSVLIATHQMDEVEALCERVILLDGGRIREDDTPQALVARYCPGHHIRFATSSGRAAQWAGRLPGALMTPVANHDDRVAVDWTVANLKGALPDLLAAAANPDEMLLDIQVARSTLEDVFLHLTGRALRD